MKWFARVPLIAVPLVCMWQTAIAATILSLSSTANLTTIGVGQSLSVDVALSGLEAGQELDSLAATIAFDGSVLGTPSIAAGPIVPNPLDDPLDLLVAETAGFADVTFLTFGVGIPDHITTNGVFFSFEVTPVTMGAGAIDFDFVGATLFNAANPNDPIVMSVETGTPLSFVVVPEPSGLTLAVMAIVSFGFLAQRCQHVSSLTNDSLS